MLIYHDLLQVKGKVARTNLTFKTANIQTLINESLESIRADDLRKYCEHVFKKEAEFCEENIAIEKAIDTFFINVSDEEATDTAIECEDNSDTDITL